MKINRKAGTITAQMDATEAGIVARALGRLSEHQEPGSLRLFKSFVDKLKPDEYVVEKLVSELTVGGGR